MCSVYIQQEDLEENRITAQAVGTARSSQRMCMLMPVTRPLGGENVDRHEERSKDECRRNPPLTPKPPPIPRQSTREKKFVSHWPHLPLRTLDILKTSCFPTYSHTCKFFHVVHFRRMCDCCQMKIPDQFAPTEQSALASPNSHPELCILQFSCQDRVPVSGSCTTTRLSRK